MKLGSLREGGRDATLVVVSRDLVRCVPVSGIALSMQAVLDRWDDTMPRLKQVYTELNAGRGRDSIPLEIDRLAAPLPRAYQWLDGSSYASHVSRMRNARGAEIPSDFPEQPMMYQGGSDTMLGARDPILVEREEWRIDFEAEVAIITDDVTMGTHYADTENRIKLLLLANDISLHSLESLERQRGLGLVQGKPSTSFSPVAVTVDELGASWGGGRLSLPIVAHVNDVLLGRPNAGVGMTHDFRRLIAYSAKTRHLSAGTIIGSGTVSSEEPGVGFCSIAEKRAVEIIRGGEAVTPFLRFGDRVRIEMFDLDGNSIFGAIDQEVLEYRLPERRNGGPLRHGELNLPSTQY